MCFTSETIIIERHVSHHAFSALLLAAYLISQCHANFLGCATRRFQVSDRCATMRHVSTIDIVALGVVDSILPESRITARACSGRKAGNGGDPVIALS